MNIKEMLLKKSNLWHLGAIVLFLVIASAYFFPAFKGYSVQQADVRNYAGAAQEIIDYRESLGEQVGWTSTMFSGMPATQISVKYEGRQISDGLRSVLSLGLPSPVSILFVYFIGFYILAIAFRAKPIVAMVGALAYGLSSYFIIIIEAGHITKAFAIGYAPLLIAGFIFAFRWKNWLLGVALSGLFMSFQLSANHLQITYYLIFVLIALGGTELFRSITQEGGIKKFVTVSVALIIAYGAAVAVNFGNIKGTMEYTDATTRGGSELTINPDGTPVDANKTSGLDKDYITAWSYGKAETFSFIVPNFKGGETKGLGEDKSNQNIIKKADPMFREPLKTSNQYWGDQPFTSGPVYIGVIVVLLSLLSLAYSKEKSRWPLFIVTVVTVMLSWGKNFMGFTDLFLSVMPGYDKFRAVTIILVIAELCVPLLAVFFLQKLYKAKDEIQKNLVPFFSIAGGIFVILTAFFLLPSAFNTFLSDQELMQLEMLPIEQQDIYGQFFDELESVRISLFRRDVGRSIIFLLLAAGAIYAYLKNAFNNKVVVTVLGVLIFADLLLVDTRYLNTSGSGKKYDQWVESYKQKYPYVAGEGEKQILALELQENPALMEKIDSAMTAMNDQLKGKGIEGAHKNRIMDWSTFRALNRYTNFRVLEEGNAFNSSYASYFNKSIGGYHGAKLSRYQDLIEFHLSNNNPAVLDMLNTKYVLRPQYDQISREINGSILVRKNESAMGNAWLSKEVKFVANADEEILALNSSNLYQLKNFGEHKMLVNGERDTVGLIAPSDQVELLFMGPLDSAGVQMVDTIPVEIPFAAVTQELPIVYVLTAQGATWDYLLNVDSTKIPLIAVMPAGKAGWNPSEVTVVDQRYQSNVTQEKYSGQGEVKMTSYHPDALTYSFNSNEKQLVVFSEIFYPVGWKAYVDGAEVPITCVNYVLRAVEVPAGEHKIELIYKLDSYSSSATVAWIGSILLLILLGAGIYMSLKSPKVEMIEEELD